MEVEQPENTHRWDWVVELQQEAQTELPAKPVDPRVVVLDDDDDDDDSEYQLSDEDPDDKDIEDAEPEEEDLEEFINIDGMGTLEPLFMESPIWRPLH